MKGNIFKFVPPLLCAALFASGFSYQNRENESQIKHPETKNVAVLLNEYFKDETNDALEKKYGTNWVFHPQTVCETEGEKVTIEGLFDQNKSRKELTIYLSKDGNLGYKVTKILVNNEYQFLK